MISACEVFVSRWDDNEKTWVFGLSAVESYEEIMTFVEKKNWLFEKYGSVFILRNGFYSDFDPLRYVKLNNKRILCFSYHFPLKRDVKCRCFFKKCS